MHASVWFPSGHTIVILRAGLFRPFSPDGTAAPHVLRFHPAKPFPGQNMRPGTSKFIPRPEHILKGILKSELGFNDRDLPRPDRVADQIGTGQRPKPLPNGFQGKRPGASAKQINKRKLSRCRVYTNNCPWATFSGRKQNYALVSEHALSAQCRLPMPRRIPISITNREWRGENLRAITSS